MDFKAERSNALKLECLSLINPQFGVVFTIGNLSRILKVSTYFTNIMKRDQKEYQIEVGHNSNKYITF